jgi:hemolysin III
MDPSTLDPSALEPSSGDSIPGPGTDRSGDGPRPRWRGVIHRWGAIVSVPAFVALVVAAPSGIDRWAVVVYAVGIVTMLTTSAVYHSGRLRPAVRDWVRRVDHSAILLAIAGSYTAVATLALTGSARRTLLVAVWIAAGIGIVIRMAWLRAPYPVIALVNLTVGWCALLEIGAIIDALDGVELALLLGGGLLYTAGGVIYALGRPDPRPEVFGYHEVFHSLVVAAVLTHYVLVWLLLDGA